MSSFFGRKSGKTHKSSTAAASTAALQPPSLARAQSADAAMPRIFDVEPQLHMTQSDRPSRSHRAAMTPSSSVSSSTTTSSRSREKRKPIVVHYLQAPSRSRNDPAAAAAALTSSTHSHSASRRTATYSTDIDDDSTDDAAFDVESAISNFATSFSPLGTKSTKSTTFDTHVVDTKSRASRRQSTATNFSATTPLPQTQQTRARSSTRARLAMSLTSSEQRHAQRAERQTQKYDVEWRADTDAACCQVCYAMFTKLSRRRHHCRVCGDLVCGDCSVDQVQLHGRFDTPKRACTACVTLLQVLRLCGDTRVRIDRVDTKVSSSDTKSKCSTEFGGAVPPPATPRYHDRLGEVHRVMAAGKKSERRGSTQTEMFVIASSWLRAWLAFTRSASDSAALGDSTVGTNSSTNAATTDNRFAGTNSSSASGTNAYASPSSRGDVAPPPGPIDNLPLLELRKGKLVKRCDVVRDDGVDTSITNGTDGSTNYGDFQLISLEVWEVLHRLYGGGPAVRVTSADGFSDWLVDVAALVASASTTLSVPSTVEHVLVTRHEAAAVTRASHISVEKAALISSGGFDARASHTHRREPARKTQVSGSVPALIPNAAGTDRATIALRASHNSQARVRPNSPQHQLADSRASSRFGRGTDVQGARASVRAPPAAARLVSAANADASESDADLRGTTAGPAATAASAFAVAMKQARLNAQKAIDDRSRGGRSADAA